MTDTARTKTTDAPTRRFNAGVFVLTPVSRADGLSARSWWVDAGSRDDWMQRAATEARRMQHSWFGYHMRDEFFLARPDK